MSGFSMMFIGTAWCVLAWIFVRYYGVNEQRVLAFVLGAGFLAAGILQTILGGLTR